MSRWVKVMLPQFGCDDEGFPSVIPTFPHEPAVYVVYRLGEVKYVGSTFDLCTRVRGHKRDRDIIKPGIDSYVKYSISRRYGDWAMRELRLIKRLRPMWNKVHTAEKSLSRAYLRKKAEVSSSVSANIANVSLEFPRKS